MVELGHLTAHLPGDHRRHELHGAGRLEVEGEPEARGPVVTSDVTHIRKIAEATGATLRVEPV